MAHGSTEHSHGHRQGHGHQPPPTSSAEQRWHAQTAQQLTRPTDRLVADIGCGEAAMAIELARVLSTEGKVVALDSAADALERATKKISDAGLTCRITTIAHDLTDGVEPVRVVLAGVDLIWASSSLHHVGDQQRVITGLAGLLGRGGRLALAEGGLAERHLPWDLGVGQPGMEIRLDAAQDRWFGQMRAELPGSVPMPYGWAQAMRLAGLCRIATASVLFEEPAPLASAIRDGVLAHLTHRVDRLASGGFLDDGDTAAWMQLLDPGDPAWLGQREDIFSLSVRTLYVGVREP